MASKNGELNLPVVSENKAITDDNTNYKDMDDGIESILENISQQGAVSISDAKDSGMLLFSEFPTSKILSVWQTHTLVIQLFHQDHRYFK